MMQFRSAVRSMVAFSTATKTLANTARYCRISYVSKYYLSSLPTHDDVTIAALSSSKVWTALVGASSQDSEVCSNPDLLRRPHSDSSASLSNSSSGDSEGDDSDSATQSEGGGHQHSSSSRKAAVVRARKVSSERIKRAPSSSWKVNWTEEMDVRLTEGVRRYKEESWARVAEFMGDGLSSLQCNIRWRNYLEPLQRGLTRRNWQPEEVKRLLELVPQHLIPSQWSTQRNAMTQESTDWTTIGEELGRVPMDCSSKYKSIHNNKLKKGPFTAEEDALMRQRVEEWGDKGKRGLWVALEKEMGRDARLIEGVALHKAESWARVAEFMGDGLSAQQCCGRWSNYLGPLQRGLKRSNWQPDEVKRLLELVHLTPKKWSKRWKTECTDWKAIGRELGIVPMDCNSKYNLILSGQMKKGRFTAEDDALICQRVEEWGGKGIGLWAALEKEMDRAGRLISERWRITLSRRK